VPDGACVRLPAGRAAAIDALRGIGLALETIATLALMCDPRDLGTTLGDTALEDVDENGQHAASVPRRVRGGPQPGYAPTLFVYEHTPGGIGLAERIWEQRDVLLARTMRLIETCACDGGCPACVGPSDVVSQAGGRNHTRKSVALELLRAAVPSA
jgi:DEAD/DEAH box helicase domain-containing protein